jgi:hypothetical protein|mmetsp:Transcript_23557/g.40724  ORF Transcript_23557/g.40724 Transcript_23557/m.40724 type:complete len:159 (-) Transcript_23557:144-620(-)
MSVERSPTEMPCLTGTDNRRIRKAHSARATAKAAPVPPQIAAQSWGDMLQREPLTPDTAQGTGPLALAARCMAFWGSVQVPPAVQTVEQRGGHSHGPTKRALCSLPRALKRLVGSDRPSDEHKLRDDGIALEGRVLDQGTRHGTNGMVANQSEGHGRR